MTLANGTKVKVIAKIHNNYNQIKVGHVGEITDFFSSRKTNPDYGVKFAHVDYGFYFKQEELEVISEEEYQDSFAIYNLVEDGSITADKLRPGVAYPVDKVIKLKPAAQALLESFAKLQEANAPKYIYPCPRCGSDNMDEKITRNALSRRANVHICSDCGTHEALLDMSGQEPLPFEEWNLFLLIDTLRTEK